MLEKTLMLEKTEGKRRKGTTEDEMVGWHHQLNGHDFEQTLGDSEGQENLVCYRHGVAESLTQLSDSATTKCCCAAEINTTM